MSKANRMADLIIEDGCYVRNQKERAKLPDGSDVLAYLSLRRLFSKPETRKIIEESLAKMVTNVELVVGVATAGIPWAHAVATRLKLPLAYVRSSKKSYGIGNLVEGNPLPKSKAVLIDDILFTGESIFASIAALKDEFDIDVIQVVSICTLNGDGVYAFQHHGIKEVASLLTYREIIDSALSKKIIDVKDHEQLDKYYARSGLKRRKNEQNYHRHDKSKQNKAN